MKKTVSIIMSMLLVVTMVAALAGCGSDQDKIVGKWETTLDMGAMLNESIKNDPSTAEMADSITFHSVDVKVTFDFKDDGTYTLTWDEDSSKSALESFKSDLKDGLGTYMADIFAADEELDMSAEEAMEMIGMNMDEMIDELLNEMDVASMLEELNSNGKYKVEDGKLYTTLGDEDFDENSYDTYEFVSDSELKLLETVGDDTEFAKSMYPITLKKA